MQETVNKLSQCTKGIFRGINVKGDSTELTNYYEIDMKQFVGNNIEVNSTKIKTGDDEQIKLRQLEKGDIIIPSRANTVSKIAIFDIDTDLPCIVNHQYWIIRPDKSSLNSYFLLSFLLSKSTRKQLNGDPRNKNISAINKKMPDAEMDGKVVEVIKKGSTMMALNRASLRDLEINLPSLEEQKKMETIFKSLQTVNKLKESTERVQHNVNDILYSASNTNSIVSQLKNIEAIISSLEVEYKKLNAKVVPKESNQSQT